MIGLGLSVSTRTATHAAAPPRRKPSAVVSGRGVLEVSLLIAVVVGVVVCAGAGGWGRK